MSGAGNALIGVGTEVKSPHRIRRKTILVIDDELGMRESLEEIFNEHFNVFAATNGEEGIDLLKRQPFDLVLLDLSMPGINGVEVLRRTRGLPESPPVMILTAHSTHERAKECADLAVVGYVEKPFDPFELFDRVRGILKEHKTAGNAVTSAAPLFANKLSGLIEEVVGYIDRQYARPMRPKDVAKAFSTPRKLLGKKFKEETGHRMDHYLNWKRIQRAKELLLQGSDTNLSGILYKSGFKTEAHFLRVFKRYTGTTPADFRKSNGQQLFKEVLTEVRSN